MKTKRSKKIFILLILISVVSIVVSLNKYINLPWDTEITTENPIVVQSNNSNTIIMDGDMRGILILNKNNELQNRIELGLLNPTRYFWPWIVLNNNYLYYAVGEYADNSFFLSNEEIFRASNNGKESESLLSLQYDQNSKKYALSKILNIFERKGVCYAAVMNTSNNAFAVINISDGSNRKLEYKDIKFDKKISAKNKIALVWYDSGRDKIYAMDQFGQTCSWKINMSGIGTYTDSFESKDYYRTLYAYTPAISTVENIKKAETPEFSDDRYNYIKHKPAEIKAIEGLSFRNSKVSQVRIWMFWLGVLFLSFSLILLFVKNIHSLRIQGKFDIIKRIGLIVAIGISSLIIVIFYSYQLIDNTYDKTVSMQSVLAQMTQRQTKALAEQAKAEFDANGQLNPDTYNSLVDVFEDSALVSANEGYGTGFSFTIYKDNKYYPIINTSQVLISASINKGISEIAELKPDEILSEETFSPFGSFGYSRVVYSDNSGKPIAMLYASSNITVITADFLKLCVDIFLKLFVGALVVVYAVMEIIAWIGGFKRRRILLQEGINFQGIALARPLVFLSMSVNAADSALIVLIVKDMLIGTPYEGNLVICSLPMTAMALGFLLGAIAANSILSRFAAKKTLLASTIIMTIALIGEAGSVYVKNIPLLLLSMIIMTISNEIIIYYAYGYAGYAPNDDLRRACNAGVSASWISGYAIITVFAGYASTMFGNYTIYLVALVPSAILFAIILLNSFDSRRILSSESGEVKVGLKEQLKFIGNPEMLTLIFCGIVAVEVLGGYKSYVFPLFADQGGITKSTISNIQVFAKAVVFFSLPLINKYQKRMGEKNLIIINTLVLSGVFIMFIINQSVIWAVFTLVVTYVSSKGLDSSISFIWQKYAVDKKYNPSVAQSAVSNTTELIKLTMTPILGFLLGFGQLISCVIIGAYLGISALVFKVRDSHTE